MNADIAKHLSTLCMPVLAILLNTYQVSAAAGENLKLVTAKAQATLSGQVNQAIISARSNQFSVNAPPPAGAPETLTPVHLLLSAVATCSSFIVERAAQELDVPLSSMLATIEGDFLPNSAQDKTADTHLQALRVHFDIPGVDDEQIQQFISHYTQRCPMYTTLIRSVPIAITSGEQPIGEKTEGMNTVRVTVKNTEEFGRALVTTGGEEFITDSVPPLKGPNINRNPLDLMLGSLTSCSLFACDKIAKEHNISLSNSTVSAEADFDPRGVAAISVNPRIRALRLHMALTGASEEQAAMIIEQMQSECPVFSTLSRSAPITVTTDL